MRAHFELLLWMALLLSFFTERILDCLLKFSPIFLSRTESMQTVPNIHSVFIKQPSCSPFQTNGAGKFPFLTDSKRVNWLFHGAVQTIQIIQLFVVHVKTFRLFCWIWIWRIYNIASRVPPKWMTPPRLLETREYFVFRFHINQQLFPISCHSRLLTSIRITEHFGSYRRTFRFASPNISVRITEAAQSLRRPSRRRLVK